MKSTTAGQHNFATIPSAEIQRSSFNRSSGLKTTFDVGKLIPVFVDEALPGDTFNLRMHTFARMATPLFPILDNMFLDSHFFAVPIRLIWDNWQKFNGEQVDPGDSTSFLVPQMISPGLSEEVETLSDYFGIPLQSGSGGQMSHSSLWHRASNLIYNEWFRDQNLQDSVVVDRDDGPDDYADYKVMRRGKRHDYFTSCLPFPQKGLAVELPLGSSAPVSGTLDDGTSLVTGTGDPVFLVGGSTKTLGYRGAKDEPSWSNASGSTQPQEAAWDDPQLTAEMVALTITGTADLSAATAATINDIREAFQVQRLFERDARGGSRYTEIVRSHFGVTSPDQRLQRPEYLGGGTQVVSVNPVPSNIENAFRNLGELGGVGVSQGSGHSFTKSFTEHCVIIGYVSVRADLNYQQGLDRMFSRRTRFDFFWPALAHLGEQEVLQKEIYALGTAPGGLDDDVFGYQERYAEYRYKPSKITGKMNSLYENGTLDAWHLAQVFDPSPVLNSTFIEDTPPIDRVLAVDTEPDFIFDAFFDLKCTRPMPTYSVPGMIDHF